MRLAPSFLFSLLMLMSVIWGQATATASVDGMEADGLLAICIQHEMDHLVGKLFIDYLSPLKQQRIRQKVEKLDRLRSRA